MTTLIRLAADAVALLHGAFVLFVVVGGLLVWRCWPRLAWLHLPAIAWGALIEFTGGICPLTPLEQHLRQVIGQAGYAGGFIDHYLWTLLYPAGLTPRDAMGAGGGRAHGQWGGVRRSPGAVGAGGGPAWAWVIRVSVRAWRGVGWWRWCWGWRPVRRQVSRRAARSCRRWMHGSGWKCGAGNWPARRARSRRIRPAASPGWRIARVW